MQGIVIKGDGPWGEEATLDPTTPPTAWAKAEARVTCLDQACRGTVGSPCVTLSTSAVNDNKGMVAGVKPYTSDSPNAAFLLALVQVGQGLWCLQAGLSLTCTCGLRDAAACRSSSCRKAACRQPLPSDPTLPHLLRTTLVPQAAYRPGINLGKDACAALRELSPPAPPTAASPPPPPRCRTPHASLVLLLDLQLLLAHWGHSNNKEQTGVVLVLTIAAQLLVCIASW